MPETLASLAKTAAVPFDTLDKSYRPVMGLVKQLIGVIPNCDPILEIWPIGFRTYNVLVPNMFNLPATLFGSKSLKSTMGLAMYTSSRAAQCPYCSAHTCSFAIRRGATREAILGHRTPRESAAVAMAEALSKVPSDFTPEQLAELKQHFSPAEQSQIMRSVCMMGFLNKFMDAVGVPLEPESIADVGKLLGDTGWHPGRHVGADYRVPTTSASIPKDNLRKYLKVIRHAPGAVRLDKRWTRDVPAKAEDAKRFLEAQVGYDFPLLVHLDSPRAIRAVATVLRDNLDASQSTIGLKAKCLAGFVYAVTVGDHLLEAEARSLADQVATVSEAEFEAARIASLSPTPTDTAACERLLSSLAQAAPSLTAEETAILVLARAVSPSPAEVNEVIVREIATRVSPEQMVELVVWISVEQLLHRLYAYQAVLAR
jgi:hypothetical protein